MKTETFPLLLALAAGSAVPPGDGKHQLRGTPALVTANMHGAKALPMPVVKHDKVSGNGYTKSSPLYAKQEQMKAAGELKAPGPPGSKPVPAASVSMPPMEHKSYWQMWKAGLLNALVEALVNTAIVCLFAWLYRRFYTPPPKLRPLDAEGKFQFNLCEPPQSGKGDIVLCIMSYCCLPIRWSETISHDSMKGFGWSFWPALITCIILSALEYFTWGFSMTAMLVLQIYYRQQIRRAYDHSGGGSAVTIAYDTLTWCYCCCCAAVQEAREVEQVNRPITRIVGAVEARRAQ